MLKIAKKNVQMVNGYQLKEKDVLYSCKNPKIQKYIINKIYHFPIKTN